MSIRTKKVLLAVVLFCLIALIGAFIYFKLFFKEHPLNPDSPQYFYIEIPKGLDDKDIGNLDDNKNDQLNNEIGSVLEKKEQELEFKKNK